MRKNKRHSTFMVRRSRKDGQWYVSLKAANGEKILASEGYKRFRSAINMIAAVVYASLFSKSFKKHVARNKRLYFTLMGANHEVIGTSQMYKSKQSRDRGIRAVKDACRNAKIHIRGRNLNGFPL